MPCSVRFTIQAAQPAAHLFDITLRIERPDPAGQVLSLPAWIPGSYMIREFAKNIVSLTAKAGTRHLAVVKQDKHTWLLPAGLDEPVTVNYTVYAWDLSVRTAHLDQTPWVLQRHKCLPQGSWLRAAASFRGHPSAAWSEGCGLARRHQSA